MFLIVRMMFSALCVVFDCYDTVLVRTVLFLIVTIMFRALCVAFDCLDDD